jgi:hypothetical protein
MKKITDILFGGFVRLVFAWVLFAICFQIYVVYIHFTDEEKEQRMANEFAWKFDGRFSNTPGNIWYEEPKSK